MLSTLRNLFNNGDNDGDIILITHDKAIKCHSFILEYTSEYLRSCIKNDPYTKTIELDTGSELLCIVLNYCYSEKLVDKEVNWNDILKLYILLNQLKCGDNILVLKNHYLKKLYPLLNKDNWFEILKIVFNVNKFSDIEQVILTFYKNSILTDMSMPEIKELVTQFEHSSNFELHNKLFAICLEKLHDLLNELKVNGLNDNNKIKMNTYLKKLSHISESDEENDNDQSNNGQNDDIDENQYSLDEIDSCVAKPKMKPSLKKIEKSKTKKN